MSSTSQPLETWLARFDTQTALLNGHAVGPVQAMRRNAIARFSSAGFPTMRDEEWRFTNPGPVANFTFHMEEPPSLTEEQLGLLGLNDPGTHRIVVVNGRIAAEHSSVGTLPQGATVTGLAAALASDPAGVAELLAGYPEYQTDQFVDLNTAFFTDGLFLRLANDVVLDAPVHVLYVSSSEGEEGSSNHPRSLVVLGRNAQATVIEEYVGLGSGRRFTNPMTEIVLAEGAHLNHIRVQNEGEHGVHVGSLLARQDRSSTLKQFTVSFGGPLVRNNTCSILNGEGAHATMDGVALARGTETVDNHTTLDHAVANCTSHELYKSILSERGHAVFSGRIIVRQDAQKTDSKQSNRTLLLSDEATIDAKPQLEIFADDVKCTHGATIGQLDDEQMFYLRSRGIPVDEARAILTYAFAEELIEQVQLPALREHLERLLEARLVA